MVTINDIGQFLANHGSGTHLVELVPLSGEAVINRPASITLAVEGQVTFCGKTAHNPEFLVTHTKASLLILDKAILISEDTFQKTNLKAVILSENARLDFIRVVSEFFVSNRLFGIHPSAIIASSAQISSKAYIGPLCTIGDNSSVGAGTVIHSGVQIYDNVKIGKNVVIHSGSVIGGDGFGFERNESGELQKFPHIGGVVIEDDVEICGLSHVARGTLGNTIIGQGTKIDALVHVGHNIQIGKHCVITANAMLAADHIGSFSWIAPSATLRDRIFIGEKVTVGLGSVVTKDVPDGVTVFGSPAKENEEQKRLLNYFSEVIKRVK